MNEYYKDKVVVVTGGTDGIGKSLVEQLLSIGAKVATCGRNHDRLYELQSTHPSSPLHTMVCDVSNEQDCRQFIESTIKVFGTIHVLINNAGISMRGLFKDMKTEVLKKVMDINFYGMVYCTKLALPYLIQEKGVIVGVSSVGGYRGLPARTGYSASKFAMQGFLECLRVEMMNEDVHVMWVAPGFTSSGIRNRAINEKGETQEKNPMDESKMMPPNEVAAKILKAIKNKKRTLWLSFLTKQTIFMNKFFPGWTDKLVYNFYFKDKQLVK
jgi:short-subunit dehydrogenase